MSSSAPRFSVILTTYNRANLVERAIESLKRQSFEDWECIIVDDGSKDNTFFVARPYVLEDRRFRYHFAHNQGPALSRNLGIRMSTGDYVTFLDSDDEYLVEHLATRDALLRTEDVDLLHGGVEVIGNPFVADRFKPGESIHLSECTIGGTFFVRRTLFERAGFFSDVLYGDDNEFFEKAKAAGALIQKTDLPTYRYFRDLSDSLCNIFARDGDAGIERYRGLK